MKLNKGFASLVFFILLFTSMVCNGQGLNDACSDFKLASLKKIKILKASIDQWDVPFYGSKDMLMTVILPEYLTNKDLTNTAEIAYLKICYNLRLERYKTISFGPFQMQPQFIKSNLELCASNEISDPILLDCKKNGYASIFKNLNYFIQIQTQWKILILFERNYFSLYHPTNPDACFGDLLRLYNTGKIDKNSKYLYFSKISCGKKNFEDWGMEMNKWAKECH